MFEIKATKEELGNARMVADHAKLLDIFLVKTSVESNLHRRLDTEREFTFSKRLELLDTSFSVIRDESILVTAGVRVDIELSPVNAELEDGTGNIENQDKENKLNASVEVIYALRYGLPEPPIPDVVITKGFPAFSKFNGPYNAWPYLRQEVQNLTGLMGIPLVLPLLSIRPENEQKDNDAGERNDKDSKDHERSITQSTE